jgi:molybdopterin-guanine dinucleotide biosynthesis protein B
MRIIGLAGWSGAGKTTLIVQVLPLLNARGLSVSTVKHAHHDFDVDQPGKDSYAHRQAGALEVLVASSRRFALMHELVGGRELPLATLLTKLSPVDLAVVEGFKRDRHNKIEVHRAENGKPFLFPSDPTIRGLVSDRDPGVAALPWVSNNDLEAIIALILRYAEPLETTLERLVSGGPM